MTQDRPHLLTVIVMLPATDLEDAATWVNRIYAAVPDWDTTPGAWTCVSYECAQRSDRIVTEDAEVQSVIESRAQTGGPARRARE